MYYLEIKDAGYISNTTDWSGDCQKKYLIKFDEYPCKLKVEQIVDLISKTRRCVKVECFFSDTDDGFYDIINSEQLLNKVANSGK